MHTQSFRDPCAVSIGKQLPMSPVTSKYQALRSFEASVTMVFTNRHSLTFQKNSIFSYTAVRSSNLAQPVQTLIPKLPSMTCGELLIQIAPQNMSLAVCSVTF